MSKLAGLVLLSALAVPIQSDSQEASTGKVARLTSLLGMSKMPNRALLLASALASCAMNNMPLLKTVPPPVRELYKLLENSFDPLRLCAKAAPVLQRLETEYEGIYKPYVPNLRNVILNRLLLQVSQVYDSIRTQRLLDVVKPLHVEGDLDAKIESIIVHAARRGDLSVKVDHAAGVIFFEDEAFSTPSRFAEPSKTDAVQPSLYDVARTHLSTIANALSQSLATVEPSPRLAFDFAALASAAEAERKALTLRRNIVARRRELQSELSARKEKEEAGRRAEASRREKDEEAKRALEDVRRRELERARKMQEEIRTEEVMRLAKSLKERGNLKVDMNVSLRFEG